MSNQEVYAVYEPRHNAAGKIIFVTFETEEEAIESFNDIVKADLADANAGLFVIKFLDLSEETAEQLLNDETDEFAARLVDTRFAEYKTEVVKEFGSKLEDWLPSSLSLVGEQLGDEED